MKIFKQTLFLLFVVNVVACKHESKKITLNDVIDAYEKGSESNIKIGVSLDSTYLYYKKEADFAANLLEDLQKVDTTYLNETERISKELLAFVLQDKIDQNTYKVFLNPINSEYAFHIVLARKGQQKFKDIKGVRDYLNDLDSLPQLVNYNLSVIREGLKLGYSQPKVIFSNYEFSYDRHIVEDYTKSEFFAPFTNLPDEVLDEQKDSIFTEAERVINEKVVPSYKKIKKFFEEEYFPNTRTKEGVSNTPNGVEFYQNRINYYTTSTVYTAEDIHQIGLKEVARIKAAMQTIIDELEFKGSYADFLEFLRTDPQFYPKTGRELLMIARDIAKQIDGELTKFFKTLPRKPYGVEPVPAHLAPKYTAGRYAPGFYWVNTYNLPSRTLYTLPALTAHEAMPGHHLQMSLNNELGDDFPDFRRWLYLSAYGEGWGLYSEYLADEIGIYTTPYEKFGQLTYEMWRACRLVVDTGIHAKDWTRQQAVDYMASNTALSLHEVNTEIDRYISWPGQALSYKMGEIKIRELRVKVEKELGNKFDIRDFHEVILEQGTVTLAILENRVNAYIEQTLKEEAAE